MPHSSGEGDADRTADIAAGHARAMVTYGSEAIGAMEEPAVAAGVDGHLTVDPLA